MTPSPPLREELLTLPGARSCCCNGEHRSATSPSDSVWPGELRPNRLPRLTCSHRPLPIFAFYSPMVNTRKPSPKAQPAHASSQAHPARPDAADLEYGSLGLLRIRVCADGRRRSSLPSQLPTEGRSLRLVNFLKGMRNSPLVTFDALFRCEPKRLWILSECELRSACPVSRTCYNECSP